MRRPAKKVRDDRSEMKHTARGSQTLQSLVVMEGCSLYLHCTEKPSKYLNRQ